MKNLIAIVLLVFAYAVKSQNVGILPFATGFNTPTEIAHTNDSRLFVVEKGGAIKIVKSNGVVNAENFLTLPAESISTETDRGLIGMAFHPDYATNGYFYINYTRAGDGATIIARYSVSIDPDIADAGSEVTMLIIEQTSTIHNGGTIAFGPDNLLYISRGDGGPQYDGDNMAQNINVNRGKILRLDVDAPAPYIPASNPFVGIDGNDEIWAIGLRNAWKMSFDRLTGDLWITDVGENSWEEINKVSAPLTAGLNFGWRCYEGFAEAVIEGCIADENLTFPIAQYSHEEGCSIIGGYVYRGSLFPALTGKFFYTDFCSGTIKMIDQDLTLLNTPVIPQMYTYTTFGEDAAGELYLTGGSILYKIVDLNLGATDFSANGYALFPNPAGDHINITCQNDNLVKVSLFDLAGKKLADHEFSPSGTMSMKVDFLQKGLYVVRLEDQSGSIHTTKLLKN